MDVEGVGYADCVVYVASAEVLVLAGVGALKVTDVADSGMVCSCGDVGACASWALAGLVSEDSCWTDCAGLA